MPHNLTRTHVILFILTFLSTLIAGALYVGVDPLANPEKIYAGLPFSVTLLLILLTHELCHYFFSRRNRVAATLPYFIPAPSLVGTFGAIIKMRPPIPDRKALIDIGASGPIGGFIIAIIAVIIGLHYSEVLPLDNIHKQPEGLYFGESILFILLTKMVLNIDPSHYTIGLHPIAFAGWVGFFVTSLNLLPIGQLDGGHIIYAVLGEKHEWISKGMIPVLIVMSFYYWPWIIIALLMFYFGYKHPPVVYPHISLDKKRKFIGWCSLAIFILTFTPVPVEFIFNK